MAEHRCEQCGKTFKSANALIQHQRDANHRPKKTQAKAKDKAEVKSVDKRSQRTRARTGRTRQRTWFIAGGVGLALILIAVGAFVGLNRGESDNVSDALNAVSVPLQGFQHIGQGQSHPPYNSVPATSGWHYPFTAPWGVHHQPVPDEVQVHNLEHGGIMVQYRPGIADWIVDELRSFTQRNCRLIVAPYPGLDHDIALTAWGRIDKFDEFDRDRIEAFIQAYRNQGPEQVSCP
ncbi:MAG: DUF3105 domain-containing protein [Candidatus Bipolaricaulia bacterium]